MASIAEIAYRVRNGITVLGQAEKDMPSVQSGMAVAGSMMESRQQQVSEANALLARAADMIEQAANDLAGLVSVDGHAHQAVGVAGNVAMMTDYAQGLFGIAAEGSANQMIHGAIAAAAAAQMSMNEASGGGLSMIDEIHSARTELVAAAGRIREAHVSVEHFETAARMATQVVESVSEAAGASAAARENAEDYVAHL